SGTSLWCFKNEQRTCAKRDPRRQRRDLVAETSCASEAERLVVQWVAQAFRGDTARIAVHWKERDEGADRSGERKRSLSPDRPDPQRTAARFDPNPVVSGVREKKKIGRLVIEPVATERAEQHD